jgi:tetratricopeptide (TPR) repeat protein
MTAQWLRIETFAVASHRGRWTVRQVVNEAYRVADAHPHVLSPDARVIYGEADPERVIAEAEAITAAARDASGHRARRTTPVLLSAVASHPEDPLSTDPEAVARRERWKNRVLNAWRRWWGDRLRAVIEHLDEARYHLHGLVLAPLERGRIAMSAIFPAVAARNEARALGQSKPLQDRAYRSGLRAMQDLFWRDVSLAEGHARIGAGRQRLSRAEWHARRAEIARLAEAARDIERREQRIAEVERALAEADAVRLAAIAAAQRRRAEDAEERARRAEERARRAEEEAARTREAIDLVERARRVAEQIERAGGWRASRTDAERQARLMDRIRAEMR